MDFYPLANNIQISILALVCILIAENQSVTYNKLHYKFE